MLYINNVFNGQYVSFIHYVGNEFGLSLNNLPVKLYVRMTLHL